MGQAPLKADGKLEVKKPAPRAGQLPVPAEPDAVRAARLHRLRDEVADGTYCVSAESLAAKLLRRIRWW